MHFLLVFDHPSTYSNALALALPMTFHPMIMHLLITHPPLLPDVICEWPLVSVQESSSTFKVFSLCSKYLHFNRDQRILAIFGYNLRYLCTTFACLPYELTTLFINSKVKPISCSLQHPTNLPCILSCRITLELIGIMKQMKNYIY